MPDVDFASFHALDTWSKLDGVFIGVSTSVERQHDHDSYYKEKHLIGEVAYSSRGLVYNQHGGTWQHAG